MRVALGRILLMRPDVMLLDEPSNHLDLESLIWLEQFLKDYQGALLMTSHDREFMNRVVNKVVEVDGGALTTYSGNYEFYEQQRALNEKQQQAQFERQQSMLAKEIKFIERFKARASHAAQVQSSVKMGYFAQHTMDLLDGDRTVFQSLEDAFPQAGQGSLRSLAGCFGFSGDDVEKKCRVLSGGEKARLVMAKMLYDPPNFLVLDEPTNHLDMMTKEMLITALSQYEGTMLFVSHDRHFLAALSNRVLELTPEGIHQYGGGYTEYVARTGHEAPGLRS